MNIRTLHDPKQPVSSQSIFKGGQGKVTAIQILSKHQLKEHITRTPGLLVCLEGEVVYNTERGIKETLRPGDYLNIEAMVKHWVDAVVDSRLLLFR